MNESELIKALREAMEKPGAVDDDGFLTCREICQALEIGRFTADRLIGELFEAGKLEVRKVPRLTRSGHYHPTPAYRLVSGG